MNEAPLCDKDEALLSLLTDWMARFIHFSTGNHTFHPDGLMCMGKSLKELSLLYTSCN
jgi:hypothetical protein